MDRHLDSAPTIIEMMQDVMAATEERKLQPGEFTTPQFKKWVDVSYNVAYRRIEKAIKMGLIEEIPGGVKHNGRHCRAFRKV